MAKNQFWGGLNSPANLAKVAHHMRRGCVKMDKLGAEVVNPLFEFADLEEDIGNESVRRNRVAFVLLGHAAFSRCQ